jgi:hypothetical protein
VHTLEQLRSGALAGARRLNLCCSLQTVPPEVFGLADSLEVLNLSGNQLKSLPHDLPRLHRLKVIFCSDNPFAELPEVLGDCAALQVVGFKACRIARVPGAALPPQLRWLILTDNAIAELPHELGQRPALQKLMLAGNQLRQLPGGLSQANRLELLRLSANQLQALPDWLPALPRLSWLALAGNPLGWQHEHPRSTPFAVHSAARAALERLQVDTLLGEGASGHIYRVHSAGHPQGLALKLFKGAVTSDGLPEHELAACIAAGQHPALNTPCAELAGHPQGARGVLLPLIAPSFINLAGPPSLESCTRDVYAPTLHMNVATAVKVVPSDRRRRGPFAPARHSARRPVCPQYFVEPFHCASHAERLWSGNPAAKLPATQQRRALLALEVRAFGCLLEELAALAELPAGEHPAGLATMLSLAQACMDPLPYRRPDMVEVTRQMVGFVD